MTLHRIVWLDCWRGAAVALMVLYHFLFDLHLFGQTQIDVTEGAWVWLARPVQISFLLLVGIGLFLSYRRWGRFGFGMYVRRQLLRAWMVFVIALGITLVTSLFFPGWTIHFGILHAIALSIVFGLWLAPYPRFALALGILVILGGWAIKGTTAQTLLGLPLGLTPPGYSSFDYFPLLPWMGVVFAGIFVADVLEKRGFLKKGQSIRALSGLTFLGRHSLAVYLLHQPFFFGLFWLIF